MPNLKFPPIMLASWITLIEQVWLPISVVQRRGFTAPGWLEKVIFHSIPTSIIRLSTRCLVTVKPVVSITERAPSFSFQSVIESPSESVVKSIGSVSWTRRASHRALTPEIPSIVSQSEK